MLATHRDTAKIIGQKIAEFRAERGLTQLELATRIFVARSTLANYEQGACAPNAVMLMVIARELKRDLNDFYVA